MDSNLGDIETVCLSSYVDFNNCADFETIAKSKIIDVLLSNYDAEVCVITHYNFCNIIAVYNGDLVCPYVDSIIQTDENLAEFDSEIDLLVAKIGKETKIRKNREQVLLEWSQRNSLNVDNLEQASFINSSGQQTLIGFDKSNIVVDFLKSNISTIDISFDNVTGPTIRSTVSPDLLKQLETADEESLVVEFELDASGRKDKRILRTSSDLLSDLLLARINLDASLEKITSSALLTEFQNQLPEKFKGDGFKEKINFIAVPFEECGELGRQRLSPDQFKRAVGNFSQDRIHVRTDDYEDFVIGLSLENQDSESDRYTDLHSLMIRGFVPCTPSVLETEPLRNIAGGNMFVIDSFAFIGTNILYNYQENNFALKQLGLNSTKNSRSLIDSALVSKLFDKNQMGKIVWVGTFDEQRNFEDRNGQSRQPFYHIDLFFHLLHFQDDELICLVADVEAIRKDL